MYSLMDYGRMIEDSARMQAHAEALRRVVHEGSVVVDIGCGTGIFSLIACQCGARRVYAIDPSEFVHLAAHTAAENGFSDRVTCLQAPSSAVDLPEKADVVISDLRGRLPWCAGHLPTIIDARGRMLVPGGTLIPRQDRVWLAVAEAEEDYRLISSPWVERPFRLEMETSLQAVRNRVHSLCGEEVQLLSGPVEVTVLDYATIDSADLDVSLDVMIAGPGTAHGLVLWFDAELVEGVGFSTAPGDEKPVYGRAFLPFSEPVALEPGCRVAVRLKAMHRDDDYTWLWRTRVTGPDGGAMAEFTQSSALHPPPSRAVGGLADPEFVPEPAELAEVDRAVLENIDGRTSVDELVMVLEEMFPERFRGMNDALDRVRKVVGRYL